MLVDYYSILGVSFPSNSGEITSAYIAKKEMLGFESSSSDNSNYPARIEVELAYRVLGASYVLKTLYDSEYEKAIAVGFDNYEINDDSLSSSIERERTFVINNILNPNYKATNNNTNNEKSLGMKILGCLGKIFLGFIFILVIVQVKKCARQSMRESIEQTNIAESNKQASLIESNESADFKLRLFATEKNNTLPQEMNNNVTFQEVQIENEALVYVYKVDDVFFSEFKSHALSRQEQLSNLRTVYKEMKPMIDLLIKTHRGIYYRYICRESGETTEFKIYYSDLVDLQ